MTAAKEICNCRGTVCHDGAKAGLATYHLPSRVGGKGLFVTLSTECAARRKLTGKEVMLPA